MHFFKNLGQWLSGFVFRLSLGFLVVAGPLVMVFGTPGPLKQALGDSKIYDSAVDSVIQDSIKSGTRDGPLPPDQPELQQAVKEAVTPAFLHSSGDQIIDGIYGWLEGKTAQPEFRIDATSVQQKLVQSLGDRAVAKARQAPPCSLQQTRALAGSTIDPFNLPCLAPGYDVNLLRVEIAKQVSSDNILQNPVINQDNLPKDVNGKTAVQNLTDHAKNAPEIFRWLKLTPWLLAVVALISGTVFIALTEDKRRALRKLSIATLVLGLVVIAGIFISNYAFSRATSSTGPLASRVSGPLQQPTLATAQSLAKAINGKLILFGGAYALLGGSGLLALRFTKNRPETQIDSPPTEKTNQEPPISGK